MDNPTVALVDDDNIFRFTASKTMELKGLAETILEFEHAEDALKYLRENSTDLDKLPDYIFLDINMPYMDGWMFMDEFHTFMKDLTKSISIYIVSSSIDPRDIERAKSLEGVKDYIIKPISLTTFTEILV
jgi:two-component system, chemotaxis family, chemotaxis protein CheY